jgi:hypothetical protein
MCYVHFYTVNVASKQAVVYNGNALFGSNLSTVAGRSEIFDGVLSFFMQTSG